MTQKKETEDLDDEHSMKHRMGQQTLMKNNKIVKGVTSFFGHHEGEDELHHGGQQPHPGEVRRLQLRSEVLPGDLGHGCHDSGPEELVWSNSEQVDSKWKQEEDFITDQEQNRRNQVDIENVHWQMRKDTSRRLGQILADGTEEAHNQELKRIVSSKPAAFSWYREQPRGEGIETHLTIASRELSKGSSTQS